LVVAQLEAAVVAVHARAQRVTGGAIGVAGRSHPAPGGAVPRRRSLQDRQRLADDEAELGVQRQRPVVVGGLNEPDARRATVALAPQDRLHQLCADPLVLRARIDGYRADPGDHGAFVHERAAENLPVAFGHDRRDAVGGDHLRGLERGELTRRRLDRVVVSDRDRLERVVEDPAALVGVVGGRVANGDAGGPLLGCSN
jgi:hypothetical protein